MSALCQKRTHAVHATHACFGPMADITFLFDHLVGGREQRLRHGETKCLGGLDVTASSAVAARSLAAKFRSRDGSSPAQS